MLTNADCKNATCPPGKKRERLACSGGLYLEVSPAGSKRWFWKYRKDGKEGRMALGSYPEVGRKDARDARDAAKLQKSEGRDPVMSRKVEKLKAMTPSGNIFKAVALERHALKADGWSDSHAIREKRNSTPCVDHHHGLERIQGTSLDKGVELNALKAMPAPKHKVLIVRNLGERIRQRTEKKLAKTALAKETSQTGLKLT